MTSEVLIRSFPINSYFHQIVTFLLSFFRLPPGFLQSVARLIPTLSLCVLLLILENLSSSWSLVFVHNEERQDEVMKLRMFELSPHGTPDSSPALHVPLRPEEMLPVVSDVGEDSPQTPHISRGGDVINDQFSIINN